jgi:hypothetical protein
MASSLNPNRSLDFTEEINFLNKNLNENNRIDYKNSENLINHVINEIIKYNDTIFKPWYIQRYKKYNEILEIPEDDPININELHHIMLYISDSYRGIGIHCIVIFKILRECFFSKLVEDNDTFYYEIMSCSNVLSLELVKYICKKLRIHPVFIFKIEHDYSKSSDDNSDNLTECNIFYDFYKNGKLQIIENISNIQNLEVIKEIKLKDIYKTFIHQKLFYYYKKTIFDFYQERLFGNNTRIHKIRYWIDP